MQHANDSAVHAVPVPTRRVLSLRRSNFAGPIKQGGALVFLSVWPIDPVRNASTEPQWCKKQAVRLPAGCILVVKQAANESGHQAVPCDRILAYLHVFGPKLFHELNRFTYRTQGLRTCWVQRTDDRAIQVPGCADSEIIWTSIVPIVSIVSFRNRSRE